MEKINFTNGQAPAINGTNLNQLQTNAETAINEIASSLTNITDIDSYSFGNNGYVRFKNGFQIAWNSQRVTAGGTEWSGTGIFYSDHSMGNWVKAFTNCYVVNTFCNNSTFWTTIANASATLSGNLRCFRPNNGTAETLVGVIGFGKWK